jgi:hypothetical protein
MSEKKIEEAGGVCLHLASSVLQFILVFYVGVDLPFFFLQEENERTLLLSKSIETLEYVTTFTFWMIDFYFLLPLQKALTMFANYSIIQLSGNIRSRRMRFLSCNHQEI